MSLNMLEKSAVGLQNMAELIRLQENFQAYLLDDDKQIEKMIVNTDSIPVELRLQIYRNAYGARLIEALESTYPVLKTYLGDDAFYQLGNEYISACPSTYRSIRWFGDQLPAFLKTHAQYCHYPYLYELTQIEWTMTLVFDAADHPLLQVDDISPLPAQSWPHLQIQFHSSVHLLKLFWNAFEIWQSISDEQPPPEPVCSPSPVVWALWRNDFVDHYSPVSEDEALAMNIVIQNGTFSMICDGLCQWHDEQSAVTRAAILLKGWINAGMVKNSYNTFEWDDNQLYSKNNTETL